MSVNMILDRELLKDGVTALEDIPVMLSKQNELLEQQNMLLREVIETLKWLK